MNQLKRMNHLNQLRKLSLTMLTFTSSIVTCHAFGMSPISDDASRPTIGRSGEIFTIQFTPANKQLTIGLAGKRALTIDSRKVTIFGRTLPSKGEQKPLTIVPVESHFEITDEIPAATPIEIEVKDIKTKKSEKFRLERKQP